MVINILQIIIVLFALFALSRAILRFKDGRITKGELFFWSFLWVALVVFVFLPGVIGFISKILGIGRPIDVVVYAAIVILFYLIFRIYVKIEGVEQEITTIVRKVSLKKRK